MNLISFLSTLADALINPVTLIAGLMLTGAILLAANHRRAGQALIYAGSFYLVVQVVLPLDVMLARPLENRFPRAVLPAHIDGIIVLDGGVEAQTIVTRDAYGSESALLRLIAGANLLRRSPDARLVYTGSIQNRPENTDAVARFVFGGLDIAMDRVTVENRARNTWENLSFAKALMQPKPGEVWVLVTSAVHMARSVGVARQLGWPVAAWPSDYLTYGRYTFFNWGRAPEDRFRIFDRAVHEWIGLIAYRLAGLTATLFPAPEA